LKRIKDDALFHGRIERRKKSGKTFFGRRLYEEVTPAL
jgi:hypothetical protein